MRQRVEGAAQLGEDAGISEIDGTSPFEPQMIERLGESQQDVKLDRPSRPAGHIVGQKLQEGQRALAPAVTQRIGDLAAWDQDFIA
jgi:hypothetical protein